MKKYNLKKAKGIIDKRKDEITEATLGMKEDFSWTSEVVYNELVGYQVNLEEVEQIAGIDGSCWATPVLVLLLKSGKHEIIECFTNDRKKATPKEIAKCGNSVPPPFARALCMANI